jgi:GT2 family glycosyltransferase
MKLASKVSVIIPLYDINERFFKDFLKYDLLDYPSYEILVICDKKIILPKLKNCQVKLILTGRRNTGPAEKRDLAIKKAKGDICAFIDDDAYPDKMWLKNAVKELSMINTVAVGGPGITPDEDGYLNKLGGLVYMNFFASGRAQNRFVKLNKQFVDDWPAYNLFVRKSYLKKVGGYGTSFYGGEDTFLCLKLIHYGNITYNPNIFVYHHRRALFLPHLKQIFNVGIHRGYFAKKFPQTSRKIFYFYPLIMTVGFMGSLIILSIIGKFIIFVLLLIFFILLPFMYSLSYTNVTNSILVAFGVILTHLVYGSGFTYGLMIRKLNK